MPHSNQTSEELLCLQRNHRKTLKTLLLRLLQNININIDEVTRMIDAINVNTSKVDTKIRKTEPST